MYASLARCDVVTGLSKLSSMFIPASPAQRADVSCGQNRPQQLRQPLRQLLLRLRRHHRPHPGGQDQRAIRQCRCERQDQLPGPMFHRPPIAQRKALSARTPPREEGCVPIPAGDHNSPRPHKPHRRIRCFPRDPALSAVRKNDPDPADPPTRPVRADRKPLTEQRVSRIDDPNSGYQSLRYCGVPSCSASPLSPTPSSTGSFTTPIASNSTATACAKRR